MMMRSEGTIYCVFFNNLNPCILVKLDFKLLIPVFCAWIHPGSITKTITIIIYQ
jgi:hypothetical protein